MQMIDRKKVEDCLDGSMIVDLFFDEPIGGDFIRHLGEDGRLEYFPDFARPFFRVTSEGRYVVKGVQGNTKIQVIFVRDIERVEREFCQYLDKYRMKGGAVNGSQISEVL